MSPSSRVACFSVVGVVCAGALLPCAVFCGAVLSCGAVLPCSAVFLRRCLCLLFLFSVKIRCKTRKNIFFPFVFCFVFRKKVKLYTSQHTREQQVHVC